LKASSFAPWTGDCPHDAPNSRQGRCPKGAFRRDQSPSPKNFSGSMTIIPMECPKRGCRLPLPPSRSHTAPAGKHTLYLYHFEPYLCGAAPPPGTKKRKESRISSGDGAPPLYQPDSGIFLTLDRKPPGLRTADPPDRRESGTSAPPEPVFRQPASPWLGPITNPHYGDVLCAVRATHPGVGITGGRAGATARVMMDDLGHRTLKKQSENIINL